MAPARAFPAKLPPGGALAFTAETYPAMEQLQYRLLLSIRSASTRQQLPGKGLVPALRNKDVASVFRYWDGEQRRLLGVIQRQPEVSARARWKDKAVSLAKLATGPGAKPSEGFPRPADFWVEARRLATQLDNERGDKKPRGWVPPIALPADKMEAIARLLRPPRLVTSATPWLIAGVLFGALVLQRR